MIGRSVISGATATFTPSLSPCLKVCVMTSVDNGPGENPAVNPITIPARSEESIVSDHQVENRIQDITSRLAVV